MSGTSQDRLWEDPHWSTFWPIGAKVRSRFTGNHGEVVEVCEGRHLLIRWEQTLRWDPYIVRHSSELGLERIQ